MSQGENEKTLRETLRSMLLPIPFDAEDRAIGTLENTLDKLKVETEGRDTWLRLQLGEWKESGKPSPKLRKVIRAVLEESSEGIDEGLRLGGEYLNQHARLRKQPHGLAHEEATALMSHAGLMALLARRERMSASQIALVISARHASTNATWASVQSILGRLQLQPALDMDAVKSVWRLDVDREPSAFADADISTSASIVEEVASRLGFPGNIDRWLLRLFPVEGQRIGPLLQILHYQCFVAEFFDHPTTWAYEFSPRGAEGKWVFDQYPGFMGVSGSPALNIAKAAPRFDLSWAMARKSSWVLPASGLSEILLGMEEMGFAARRELAGWLRRWLLRMIRLTEAESSGPWLIGQPTPEEAQEVLQGVGTAPTATYGILEQRVVDVGARLLHHRADWQGRGLGDSVNASNVSRRKLGDCDFQHLTERRIVAYEAHGGTLKDLYIAEHERTLRRVLSFRKQEWGDEAWTVEVCFVAYANTAILPRETTIDDVPVKFSWIPFGEFIANILNQEGLQEEFARYVATPLDQPRTPLEIRSKYKALAGYEDVQASGPGDR